MKTIKQLFKIFILPACFLFSGAGGLHAEPFDYYTYYPLTLPSHLSIMAPIWYETSPINNVTAVNAAFGTLYIYGGNVSPADFSINNLESRAETNSVPNIKGTGLPGNEIIYGNATQQYPDQSHLTLKNLTGGTVLKTNIIITGKLQIYGKTFPDVTKTLSWQTFKMKGDPTNQTRTYLRHGPAY